MTHLPRRRAPVLGAAAIALALASCGAEPSAAERASTGEEVYLSSCARCHQADGAGFDGVYPALDGNPIVDLHDPRPMLDVVRDGSGGMPGFRQALTRAEMAQVATYVRQAWSNDAPAVSERQAG